MKIYLLGYFSNNAWDDKPIVCLTFKDLLNELLDMAEDTREEILEEGNITMENIENTQTMEEFDKYLNIVNSEMWTEVLEFPKYELKKGVK